jgi:FkbM family methyltransferase
MSTVAKRMVADSAARCGIPLLHKARSFADLPDLREAPLLLDEVATMASSSAPVPADRPLALYGAGNLGRLARDFLKAVGQDFVLVIDRNARAFIGCPDWSGVRLVHPDEATKDDKAGTRVAVSVVTSAYVPIERTLLDRGFKDVVPFYDLAESFRHLHPLSNGWFAPPLTENDRNNIARILSRWDDDVSRAHHLQFVAWRRLREEWNFTKAPIPACDRVFIPEIVAALRSNEILLDAGAHHGVVIEAFIRNTEGKFRQIVAIEPDLASRTRLQENLDRLLPHDPRLTIDDCAVSDRNGEAPFHSGLGYASQLSGTGRTHVRTRRIESLNVSPTFVKLHLEGAELPALKGARQTLLDSRPIVATTVYHNADGLWATADWLMQTLAGYRFLFRNHSWCGTGAVVYAIPNERLASA